MNDTPNTSPLEASPDASVTLSPDIKVDSFLQPSEPHQTFQEWMEAKWDKQLSYHKMSEAQVAASEAIRTAIKQCVLTILRTAPFCLETDKALGQIEVALMCLNKAIALHPELKTQEPK